MASKRSAWDASPSPFAAAVASARASGRPLIDLTRSNPTTVGFRHGADVYARLLDDDVHLYDPAPTGLVVAREAVARYYGSRGASCDPAAIWLCASTSEAYAQLLALTCDPGDAIATPRPGYPVLDHVAALSGVRVEHYALSYDGTWRVDLAGLEQLLDTLDLRAVVVINPGNPTGHYLDRDELAVLETLCAARGQCLIVDEVFADYPLRADEGRVRHVLGERLCPTFALSGLSKVAALPQLKLSWVAACGPPGETARFLARAEIVNDTFLGAATPVQRALPDLLDAADGMQDRIVRRLAANLSTLRNAVTDTPFDVLDVEGGWAALVRVPRTDDDVGWALRLLERGVVVNPGYLFDLDDPPHLALSLLCEPQSFADGCAVVRQASWNLR